MSLRVSQYLERLRMHAVRAYIFGDLLDIGCGYASVVRTFSPNPENYMGIDHNPMVVQWLKKQYPGYKFLSLDLDSESIPTQRKFDTILMIAVLEHLARPERLVSSLPQLLKPAGKVVLTTPTPLGGKVHSLGGGMGVFSREAKDDHKGFYGRVSLEQLFMEVELKLIEYRPFMAGLNQVAVFQRAG